MPEVMVGGMMLARVPNILCIIGKKGNVHLMSSMRTIRIDAIIASGIYLTPYVEDFWSSTTMRVFSPDVAIEKLVSTVIIRFNTFTSSLQPLCLLLVYVNETRNTC
jgi:hypothetical protein